jgi:hypothetical protein
MGTPTIFFTAVYRKRGLPSMSALIGTLLWQAGSYALRKLGENKGGVTGEVLNTVANIVESTQGKNPAEAQAMIGGALQQLPAESRAEIYELQVELETLSNEREKNKQDHDVSMFTQEQETHRTEAKHGTDYVKNTRPWVCRASLKATMWYVGSMEFLSSASSALGNNNISGAEWEIITALLSPCLGYMGMRTVDAFSKWKTAPSSILNKLSPNR